MAKILIADDDVSIRAALSLLLKQDSHQLFSVSSPEQALETAKKNAMDIALIDMNFSRDTTSGEEGLALIKNLQRIHSDLSIIVMTGWASIDLAVKSLQHGASDFVEKPWDNKRLLSIVRAQIALGEGRQQKLRLQCENNLLQEQLEQNVSQKFVANSSTMKQVLETLIKVAASDLNIFLTGENGTGKSALAHYIHKHSARKNSNLVSVNMGAISETLFESEMFGHTKGAFTDAKENRIGRIELADNGSLFLDEIANLPLSGQAKLLRVLEERKFEKVGSSITLNANIRIISATNTDLQKAVEDGRFRQDLLYRLNSIEVRIPPLRERREDLEELSQQLLRQACLRHNISTQENIETTLPEFTPAARASLLHYDWPGNIRELHHVIERGVILSDKKKIDTAELMLPNPAKQQLAENSFRAENTNEFSTLEQIEKCIIEERISKLSGNMTDVARSLGLSRSAFYRRLEKLNIQ